MKKDCNRCNISKEISEYRKDKRWKYGVRSICKLCQSKYNKDRYIKNREKITYIKKIYQQSEKGKEKNRLARSKRRKLVNWTCDKSINYNSTQAILKKQEYRCLFCDKDITKHESRHLDHIIPLSKLGKHIIQNVQRLCCKCNLSKGNKIV